MADLSLTTVSGLIYSDGWRSPSGGATDVRNPADGSPVGRVGLADATDVALACASAADAQPAWALTVAVTQFTDDDHAVALADATEYGLSAAIHTRDLARGLAVANRLRTGMAHVNGQTINDTAHTPMGGLRGSGNGGRYGGRWNLHEFTDWRWVTAAPSAPRYPI